MSCCFQYPRGSWDVVRWLYALLCLIAKSLSACVHRSDSKLRLVSSDPSKACLQLPILSTQELCPTCAVFKSKNMSRYGHRNTHVFNKHRCLIHERDLKTCALPISPAPSQHLINTQSASTAPRPTSSISCRSAANTNTSLHFLGSAVQSSAA